MAVEEEYILYAVLSFLWLEYLWELYLSIRQHKVYGQAVKVPKELTEILDDETYQKARLYGLDKSNYSLVEGLLSIAVLTGIIICNGFLLFWNMGGELVSSLQVSPDNEILHSVCFVLVLNIFNSIVGLPLSAYYTFVLEEKHGFNKQTLGFFIKDKIKKFAVGQVIILPLVAGIVYIVKIGGDYFFIYLWVFSLVAMLFLLTVYPDFIAPLFDKYSPLADGELKTKIEELAANLKFPLYKLYVVEGSKRSAHSNAYFYGFFKNKRIVLFDTLLKGYISTEEKKKLDSDKEKMKPANEQQTKTEKEKGCDNNEVLAVLGHELGHWKLNHILKNILISQANLFLVFAVFAFLFKYKAIYDAFGFHDEQPIVIGLIIVLQFIISPYSAVLGFAMTILSRRFEFQADNFAKNLGKAHFLRAALIKLNHDNLGFPVYDWMYSMWHHSHPPLLERLKALDKTE